MQTDVRHIPLLPISERGHLSLRADVTELKLNPTSTYGAIRLATYLHHGLLG